MEPDAARQYATTGKLAARGSLHDRYAPTSWFAWVAERLPVAPGDRVLDVGCGPAWLWRSVLGGLPDDLHLTLTDAAPAMVDAAKARGLRADRLGSLTIERAEATALPYRNDAFDAVLAMHMLYHVRQPDHAIDEMVRVLRPGGRIAITSNTTDNLRALGRIADAAFGGGSDDPGASLFSLDDAERALRERFTHVERHDLVDEYDITDPEDVDAFLLSMPPGVDADDASVARMKDLVRAEMGRTGSIAATRRTGIVLARTAGP